MKQQELKEYIKMKILIWGAYNGQSPYDIFCSSHFNNSIVLPWKIFMLTNPYRF